MCMNLLQWLSHSRRTGSASEKTNQKEVTPTFCEQLKLRLEPVPVNSFKSMPAILKLSHWNAIRREVFEAASYRCAICGSSESLHCHEVWHYDYEAHVALLERLQALCKKCHQTVHSELEYYPEHFSQINEVPSSIYHSCYRLAKERMKKLDYWILDYGKYNSVVEHDFKERKEQLLRKYDLVEASSLSFEQALSIRAGVIKNGKTFFLVSKQPNLRVFKFDKQCLECGKNWRLSVDLNFSENLLFLFSKPFYRTKDDVHAEVSEMNCPHCDSFLSEAYITIVDIVEIC